MQILLNYVIGRYSYSDHQSHGCNGDKPETGKDHITYGHQLKKKKIIKKVRNKEKFKKKTL